MQTQVKITGMHCTSCKRLIEDVCKDVQGVQDCVVDFSAGIATLSHDESMDFAKIKEEVAQLGGYVIEKL